MVGRKRTGGIPVADAYRRMAPRLAAYTLSLVVKHDDWICVVDGTECLASPSHRYEGLVAGMACVKTATIPFANQERRLNGLQQVEDLLNLGLGNWGPSFAELYKLFLRAVRNGIIIQVSWSAAEGMGVVSIETNLVITAVKG
jgi:hypothetical protein